MGFVNEIGAGVTCSYFLSLVHFATQLCTQPHKNIYIHSVHDTCNNIYIPFYIRTNIAE